MSEQSAIKHSKSTKETKEEVVKQAQSQQYRHQSVCTMFITNNYTSFHLWWEENLVKYQKVLKYYVHDCSYTGLWIMYANLCQQNEILKKVITTKDTHAENTR